MGARVRVWIIRSALAVMALLVLVLLALHTGPAERRILEWSTGELERRFGLDLTADALDFNLLTRRVDLTGVQLSAVGAETPFFSASRVRVRLPWVVFRGQLTFDEIAVSEGVFSVVRDRAGVSNLPGGGSSNPDAPARRLDVRRIEIAGLDFSYADAQRDIDIRAPGIRATLDPDSAGGSSGPLAIDGALSVRVREQRTQFKPVKGTASFNGSDVSLSDLGLDAPEAVLTLAGAITRVLDRPTLDLTIAGTADIGQAVRWAPPPIHVAGRARLDATMRGAPSAFELDARVQVEQAEVGAERNVAIDAVTRLTPNSVVVSASTIRPRTGGAIQATVDMAFGADAPWTVQANWRGLDAASAFRLADVRALPFGAALSGTARLTRAAGQPFRLEARNSATARPHAGTAPLEGDVEFRIAGNTWTARQQHQLGSTRLSGDIGGAWNRDEARRSTFDGTLTVQSADLGEAARHAELFGAALPDLVTSGTGPFDATVMLGGTFASPRVSGTLSTPGVTLPSIGTTALAAAFDASSRAISATDVEARVGTASARGHVRADLTSRVLAGRFDLTVPSVRDVLTAMPDTVALEGPLNGTATLGGTLDRPDIAATVRGAGLTLAGQPVTELTADVHIIDGAIQIDRFAVRQAAGDLQGTGRYDWGSRTFEVDATAKNLEWRGTLARLGDAHVRVSGAVKAAGPIEGPIGGAEIQFDVSEGLAGELIDRGTASIRLTGDTALVTAHVPSLGALLTASVVPESPFPYDAVVVMNRIDLVPLLALSGLPRTDVSGLISLSATAKGALSTLAQSRAFLNLQDLDAQAAGVPIRLAVPSRVSWDGTALVVDALDFAVGQGRLRASGRWTQGRAQTAEWQAALTGDLADLMRIGRPFGVPEALEGQGPVTVTWRSTGGLEQSRGSASLTGASVTWDTLPPVRDIALDATFDGRTLDVTSLTAAWQDGRLQGTASIPRAVLERRDETAPPAQGPPGTARLKVVGLTEEALIPWLGSVAGIDGRVSATADLTLRGLSIGAVTGQLTIDEAAMTIAGVDITQPRPATIDLRDGAITLKDVTFSMDGSPLDVAGTIGLTAGNEAMTLTVRGTADLRILSAFAPTMASEGQARINLGIGGRLRQPVFSGRVDFVDAEVALREPRLLVSELNGTVALDGQRLLLDNLAGALNGGVLTLDGGFLMDGFRPASGGLTAQVDGAAIEYPTGLQSEADAIVTLRPSGAGWTLTGEVRIERSAYNQPISLAALVAARGARPATGARAERWIDSVQLNLFVITQDDLQIDNNYGRLEAGMALRVGGTVASPVLSGRATLREGGEVYLAGNTFHVSRGSISFTNPSRIVPEFDIELRSRVLQSDVALTLEGPLDRLETEVRSLDPNVTSREAMALLFGGLQGEDAVALLSSELLGGTGRALGLDTLRVDRGFSTDEFRADPGLVATEVDPAARLTLSKRLRRDVELTLSQSLRESGGLSAIVSYKPRRNIEVRVASRDNNERSVALRHEITFGGSGTPDPTAAAPAAPTITEVTISGEPGRTEADVRAHIESEPGEPFRFNVWQGDLERLRQWYHDRGHYNVRVRGTRRPSDDEQRVALDVRIEPGPVAELVIEGARLDGGLEEEIREAWRRTIFDRFLLEDIRSRVRRRLVEAQLFGGTVDARVTVSTPELKRIVVTIQPGTEVRRRSVRYTGAQTFDADRLDREVENAGLSVDGWLDPRLVAEALLEFYRNEAFLAATVSAGEPVVDGDVAVLPIDIVEGRRYLTDAVTFPGVDPSRLTLVREAAGFDAPVPATAATLDAARRRLEDVYAKQGFNTIQIDVDTLPDPERGTVDVSFAVAEGLQHVLREVTTVGAVRTREGVIDRALRLRIGEPVALSDWSLARKRLYDTNVFRQVDIEPVPLPPSEADTAAGVQPVRAVVRVVEYPAWRLRYGTQVTDETVDFADEDGRARLQSLGILADLQNQNVFGRAFTAGIAGRYERKRQAASLFTSNSSFFGLPIWSSAFVFGSRQRFDVSETFTTVDERLGVSAEQRWRVSRRAELLWSYRFERSHTFDPNPPPFDPIPLDVVVNISRLNSAIVFDRRNDPSNPSSGWFNSTSYEQAIEALGSDYGNAKLLAQQSVYQRMGPVVLAGRAQFGAGFGGEALITSERFLLGGATTVRGYAEDSIGPRDVLGFPTGGDALLNFNGEVRFPVRGWVEGVGFVDAGNVFATRSALSLANLTVGYGLGLRLVTPFAMLRVDFGIPASTISPTHRANQLKSGRWYLGIGHVF